MTPEGEICTKHDHGASMTSQTAHLLELRGELRDLMQSELIWYFLFDWGESGLGLWWVACDHLRT